jgi:hypothetical protein
MSWGDVRLISVFLALMFLFSGDPDVWDRLHDAAMQVGCIK